MLIGINAAAAFKQPRTGVEEYTYQLIKHLAMLEESRKHRFLLYSQNKDNFDFSLPDNFEVRQLKWPWIMWTQTRLSFEMLKNQLDVLFIPVHVLPLVHPKNSIVALHGLEYEYEPKMYPLGHLKYLRWSTKYALKNARKIIAVSENTKKDLIGLYNGNPEKIEVVHHGVDNQKVGSGAPHLLGVRLPKKLPTNSPYILYIGRLETKKNIQGLIRAFELLKKKYQVSHQLILVGPKGYGSDKIRFKKDVIEKGYISEREKTQLLQKADMFVLPSFYEGFGMPLLEAQAAGCPVITSNVSSMPEVAGEGAILVEPRNVEEICQAMYKVISDKDLRKRLVNQGYQNVKKFSWRKCARETLKILTNL